MIGSCYTPIQNLLRLLQRLGSIEAGAASGRGSSATRNKLGLNRTLKPAASTITGLGSPRRRRLVAVQYDYIFFPYCVGLSDLLGLVEQTEWLLAYSLWLLLFKWARSSRWILTTIWVCFIIGAFARLVAAIAVPVLAALFAIQFYYVICNLNKQLLIQQNIFNKFIWLGLLPKDMFTLSSVLTTCFWPNILCIFFIY